MLRIWCSTVLLSILCVLSACTVTHVRKPEEHLQPLASQQRQVVVSKLDAEQITSIRRLFQAIFVTGAERYTMRLAFVFAEPNKLRIELLPLNSPVSLNLITSVDGDATYIDWAERLVVKGQLSDLLALSFLESHLSDAQIRSVLGPNLVSSVVDGRTEIYERGSGFIFASPRAYYATDANFRLEEFEIGDSEGAVLLRGFNSGKDIHIELVEAGHALTLHLVREKLSEPVSDKLFAPLLPGGFSVRQID